MKLENEEKCTYCREYGNLPCEKCNKKLEAKKAMSKRLEEIKDEYVIELYPNYDYISDYQKFKDYFASRHVDWYDSFHEEVAIRYAREVAQASLEKASKNASAVLIENKAGIVIPYVSKGSITNPDNIVLP